MIHEKFLRLQIFLQIKGRGPNFWEEPILQKFSMIWSPLLYFNFKSFMDKRSLSFFRLQCILHDSGVISSEYLNFCKLKRMDLISGELIQQKVCIIWSPLLYFNFRSFKYPNSSSSLDFNAFCMIQEYISQTFKIGTN